jgi:hypothetical protein
MSTAASASPQLPITSQVRSADDDLEANSVKLLRASSPVPKSSDSRLKRFAKTQDIETPKKLFVHTVSVLLRFAVIYGVAELIIKFEPTWNVARWVGYDPQTGSNPNWTSESMLMAAIQVASSVAAFELLGLVADRVIASKKVQNFITQPSGSCSTLFSCFKRSSAQPHDTEMSVSKKAKASDSGKNGKGVDLLKNKAASEQNDLLLQTGLTINDGPGR